MEQINMGYDAQEIAEFKAMLLENGDNYIINEEEPNSEEFVHFSFVGTHKGKEVIFDAVMITLRLMHNAKLEEMAEEEAKKQFPHYKGENLSDDEEGNITFDEADEIDEDIEDFKASVVLELEEEGSVKVQESLDIDEDFEYGVGLEVVLNIDEIEPAHISKFVKEFNAGTFKLNPNLYSFQHDEETEE